MSKEEMQKMFLGSIRRIVNYWGNLEDKPDHYKCEGVAFSILSLIDGCSGSFPCGVDLVLKPHPEDKDFCIEEGEDYVEDGMVLNDDIMLHEQFCKGNIL